MTTYEHDLMSTEIRVRDLTPGDLVSASDLTGRTITDDRVEVTSVVQSTHRGERFAYVTAGTVVHKVSPDLPVTVNAAICSDCGDCVGDCVCEDQR